MTSLRLLAAASLLAISSGALAHGTYYPPVVSSDPAFMISIGTPGFSMAYGSGAYGYYGPAPYYGPVRYYGPAPYYPPARVIVAPPYRGKHAHHHRYYAPRYYGGPGRGYGPHDKRPYRDD
ncbi:MAG: hypothetical protein MUE59_00750 [Thiobacillaceae bacterium]|jgi:hypothetical protein|nr:hypothetical protein [Thiobacillaceae bacterium]